MAEYIEKSAAVALADYAADEHPYEKQAGKPEACSEYNQGWNDACDYIRDNLEEAPAADVVSKSVYEQAAWERDLAILQLKNDYGVGLGEKKRDVAPVRRGKWKERTISAYRGTDDFGDPIYRDVSIYCCSNCDRETVIKERYCPNCGAKMDLEDEA